VAESPALGLVHREFRNSCLVLDTLREQLFTTYLRRCWCDIMARMQKVKTTTLNTQHFTYMNSNHPDQQEGKGLN
jgi:hypothetical protein